MTVDLLVTVLHPLQNRPFVLTLNVSGIVNIFRHGQGFPALPTFYVYREVSNIVKEHQNSAIA